MEGFESEAMILYLGAHPDDIELGCGGYIAKSKQKNVSYVFTLHNTFRYMIGECADSFNYLNLEIADEGNFKGRELNRQEVLDKLVELKKKYNPKIVFTHSSFDCHQDHKVIHEETIRAFKHCTILGYNLPWNNVKGSDFRYYVSLDAIHVKTKLTALKQYQTQENRSYFDPEYQKALLRVTGEEAKMDWAEKFEIIRWID